MVSYERILMELEKPADLILLSSLRQFQWKWSLPMATIQAVEIMRYAMKFLYMPIGSV